MQQHHVFGNDAMFDLGQILATPGTLDAIKKSGEAPAKFISRHVSGDWGDLDAEDQSLNDEAIRDGSRILSAYHTSLGAKVWVITEAVGDDGLRAATTILLPEEY